MRIGFSVSALKFFETWLMIMTTTPAASAVRFKAFFLGGIAIASAGLTVLRIFGDGIGLPSVAFPFLTLGFVLLFGALAFCFRGKFHIKQEHTSLSTTFSSSALAFLFLTLLVVTLFFRTSLSYQYYAEDVNKVVSVLVKVFAACSAVYFLMNAAWAGIESKYGLHLGFSFAPILYFACRILNEFINNSTNPTGDSHGYLMFSLIFFMLFFLTESKALILDGNAFRYLLFGAAAVILSSIYNVTNLVGYLNGEIAPIQAIYSLLAVALSFHVIIRMATLPPVLSDGSFFTDEEGMIVDEEVFITKEQISESEPETNE